ncbi:DNA (cytosine-5-)-methyltransferase [Proteinivorax hydrogeniformans]|uniref:Cytosine-specific methyltransferase n=1 Tax=Proteinivorax hydrogeniformans TaxID=1826727 RepID=A0AAU8HV01_9FIRM
MKKQIHIKLPDRLHQELVDFTNNNDKTIQEYVVETLDEKLKEQITMYEFIKKTKDKNSEFTFIDLFAGIGGMRLGFERVGGECVFTSEWDKFCQQTYYENFGDMPEGDITKIDEKTIPDHDILLAGFPCQPFSIAGVSKKNSLGREHGFLDKTQGTLFFDIIRILKEKRPKAFLLENVKNLTTHDKKKTFKIIKEALESLDYKISYQVMNGKHYVPQHRERIYIVGIDKKVFGEEDLFHFPEISDVNRAVQDILEEEVDKKYTLTDRQWDYLIRYKEKHQAKGNGFGYGLAPLDGITRTLSARYYKDGSEILIPQAGKNPRKLTPRECARLQGFPDSFRIVVSNTQAYKQFGNSVVVPLIEDLAKQIKAVIKLSELKEGQSA